MHQWTSAEGAGEDLEDMRAPAVQSRSQLARVSYVCVCMYVCVCVCMCMHMYVYVCVCMCRYATACVYVCM